MEELGEVAVRTFGGLLRIIVQFVIEFLLQYLAEPIGRLIAAPYRSIRTLIGRCVPWDILATPLALLCFTACTAALFYAVVRAVQWMVP